MRDSAKEAAVNSTSIAGRAMRRLNPLAKLLGPIQNLLGRLNVKVRALRRVLDWHDRATTLWLQLGLLLCSLLLALVPWSLILGVLLRLLGIGLLGPQMYFVGKRRERAAEANAAKERAYADGDESTRARMLDEGRAALMAAARRRVDKAQKKLGRRSAAQVERDALLAKGKHNLIVRPSRVAAMVKGRAAADPTCSRCYPAPDGW
jgi:hypothetical protein